MKCPQCMSDNLPDSRFCHKCATPLPWEEKARPPLTQTMGPLTVELERGSLVAGRYEVIEELGRGGMGKVYKVFDRKVKEVVALKLIKPEISVSEKAVERFKNELRFARKIAHRHVCRMYDVGEEGLTHFLTMEYIPGEDLKAFIRRSGRLTPAKAADLGRQTAEGLAEAHRLGVVHRDLKPQNVMIDKEGNARIMDFGIARIQEVEGLTGSGVFIGTPEYMSPEQAEMRNIDGRTDIYSLGVVLYEMVVGRVPFEGETPLGIAMKHKSEPPLNPRELNPHVPPDLAAVILKCLAKDRDRRYQTAEELAADLAAVSRGLPLSETGPARREPITSREFTVKFRLKKLFFPAAALAVLALAAVILWPSLFPRASSPSSGHTVGPAPSHVPRPPDPQEGRRGGRSTTLSRVKDEALRFFNVKDFSELNDAERLLNTMKAVIPSDSALSEPLETTSDKIRETKKLQGEGRAEEARKAGSESRAEMHRLMAMVAERDGALSARSSMLAARTQASRAGRDGKNLLFRLADYEEQNAESALARNDFSGAEALFTVLAEAYHLSLAAGSDEDGCRSLQRRAAERDKEVRSQLGPSADRWLMENAGQIKAQADMYLGRKEFENSAACYFQALFLFQRIEKS